MNHSILCVWRGSLLTFTHQQKSARQSADLTFFLSLSFSSISPNRARRANKQKLKSHKILISSSIVIIATLCALRLLSILSSPVSFLSSGFCSYCMDFRQKASYISGIYRTVIAAQFDVRHLSWALLYPEIVTLGSEIIAALELNVAKIRRLH